MHSNTTTPPPPEPGSIGSYIEEVARKHIVSQVGDIRTFWQRETAGGQRNGLVRATLAGAGLTLSMMYLQGPVTEEVVRDAITPLVRPGVAIKKDTVDRLLHSYKKGIAIVTCVRGAAGGDQLMGTMHADAAAP